MMVNKKRLYGDVEFLSKLNPPRNYKNLQAIERAASYIENEFKNSNLTTKNQYFTVEGNQYRNVIASYNPEKKKRFIIGAHYDVYDQLPGADDNASAVAGLLEIGRLLSEFSPVLNYRIDLVAFCLEEPPFFGSSSMGSAVHAKYLKDNKIDIIGMLCLEMIGYFSEEPNSQDYPLPGLDEIYPDKGNFIIIAGKEGQERFAENITQNIQKNSTVDTFLIIDSRLDEFLGLSDHSNYWELDYNAVMINDTSFMRNPNYHQETDTIDTLDFSKMAEVIKGCYYAVINMED